MSMDLSSFVPRKTELVLGGMKLEFTELDLADIAEFHAEARKKHERAINERRKRLVQQAKEIGDIDPMELLREVEKPPSEEEIEEQYATIEGMAMLGYLSLRHKYPDINREDVSKLITPTNCEQVTIAMFSTESAKNPVRPVGKTSTGRRQ